LADTLKTFAARFGRALDAAAPGADFRPEAMEVGSVVAVGDGIAEITGLDHVRPDELIRLPDGLYGLASSIARERIGVILLGHEEGLLVGADALRTGRAIDVPVGDQLLGRVVDALGRPVDGEGPVAARTCAPVERPAPAIIDRAPVTTPLQTGIKAIDATIPIGRGQRELILGDRQTGKTAIAVDTIINQRDQAMLCVYCAIGQRAASVASVVAELKEHGAMDYTMVMVAEGDAPPGLQYIAPYAATTVAEHFMESGRDVLIVYDDLTRHARAYRELALLLRRPPGREAFPGDIFYVHSRLLERATHLVQRCGGGSLTALPILETEAQNLSAYIPTNLISITDGQVYLSPELFHKGLLPAIDIGKSVSRVGGKTQLAAYRAVAGDLRLTYSQFEELEAFSRFGTRLDEETRQVLARGRRVRAILKQPQFALWRAAEQVMVLHAVNSGVFDPVSEEDLGQAEEAVRASLGEVPKIAERIAAGEEMSDEELEELFQAARRAVRPFAKGDKETEA
jgi:F-type H+-transporting ATPase subunit alpha